MKSIIHISITLKIVIVLFSAWIMLHAEEPSSPKEWSVSSVFENPNLEITIRGYPDVVQFGDTIHLVCTYKNVGDQVIDNIMLYYLGYGIDFNKFPFIHNVDASEIYVWLPARFPSEGLPGPTPRVPLLPGESHVMYVHSFELPLLEDMNASFWKNLLADSSGNDWKCTLQMPTKSYKGGTKPEQVLTHDIRIKPRSYIEMALLNYWLPQSRIKYLYPGHPESWNYAIDVGGMKYFSQLFMRSGSQKPPME